MDILLLLRTPALGVVKSLTEFLPTSSTGHLIVLGDLLNSHNSGKMLEVAIQLGTVLAVIFEYRQHLADIISGSGRNRKANRFALNLAMTFAPVAVVGLLFSRQIELYLFNPITVAMMLVPGGLFILWVKEHQSKKKPRVMNVDDMRPIDMFVVDCTQTCVLVPGTSYLGGTTVDDMLWGLERKTVTEFLFFLAVPMMTAATGYNVLKHYKLFTMQDVGLTATGFVAVFLADLLAVKTLLKFMASKNYVSFTYYHIVFGDLILFTWTAGWTNWAEQRHDKLKRGRLKRDA